MWLLPRPYGAAARPRRHRARPLAAGAAALLVAGSLAGCSAAPRAGSQPRVLADCTVSALLVPSCGALWGAASEPSGGQSQVDSLLAFERALGMTAPIAHMYHTAGDVFPTAQEAALVGDPANPRILFVNWRPEGTLTWAQVAAGGPLVDKRIDRVAQRVKAALAGRPWFLSIVAEPENKVIDRPGSGYTADDYRAMFRYVVTRLRADGVHNMVTVMDYMGIAKWGVQPWFGRLYPGDDVVDWVAFDAYVRQSSDVKADLPHLLNGERGNGWPGFLAWASQHAPGKPVMLAEWGAIADPAHAALKTALFRSVGSEVATFPQVKAYVYWESPRPLPVDGGRGVGNTAVPAGPVLDAFKWAVSRNYFTAVNVPRS